MEISPAPEQRIAQLEQENAELREKEVQWEEEKKQLIKEREDWKRDAITDNLTGVFNPRGLEKMAKVLLPREGVEGGEERGPSKDRGRQVVAMFDLDNFKKLNTDYGHLKANEVLKEAAQVLKGFVRESDVVGRFGGEEFVVIFTNASGENIKARLLDEETGQWKMSFTTLVEGEVIQSSFSGGVTEVREDETVKDFQAIMERANQAMRQAKENGKNQVIHYEENLPEEPNS
jgi:two-component system cell cycle response regulator